MQLSDNAPANNEVGEDNNTTSEVIPSIELSPTDPEVGPPIDLLPQTWGLHNPSYLAYIN